MDPGVSHEVLRSAIDAVPRAIAVLTRSGRIVLWSSGAERMLGWSEGEVIGTSVLALLAPGGITEDELAVDLADPAFGHGDVELISRNGGVVPVRTTMTPLLGLEAAEPLVLAVSDDTRAVQEIQDESRALSAHLRLALDAGGFGTWRWDLASGRTTWDGEMERLFGLPPGGFDGTFEGWKALVHPDDWDEVAAVLARALEDRQPYRLTHRVVLGDGTLRWIEGAGRVTLGPAGEVTGTIGCSHDITDRAVADAERDRLRRVADASLDSERLQRERLETISAVNEALEESEGMADLMRRVTGAVVPTTADWCALYLFEDPHDPVPLAEVAHRDPAMVRFARELMERHPVDRETRTGIAEVIRTRRPSFHPVVDDTALDATDLTEDQRVLVRRLALRSAIAVPVVKRGRVFGAMQLVMAHDSRRYSEDDLALAELLAARIAATLDNRQLRRERARTAKTDGALARLGRRLAASASETEVLSVILADAPRVLDASRVAVGLQRSATTLAMHGFPHPMLALDEAGPVAEALLRADAVLRASDPWAGGCGLEQPGAAAGALVASPLFDDVHQPMGVLVLSWAGPVDFDEEDLNTVETLSRLCGQAIVRSQLAGHTAAVADLAAGMAAARSTADVARLLRDHAARHLGTTLANVRLLDDEQALLVAALASDLPAAVAKRYERVPLRRSTPLTDAVSRDEPIWLPDLDEYRAQYPEIAPEAEDLGLAASAVVPLHHSDGAPVGALALAWPEPMPFDPRFRSRVTTITDLAGQTLERVRLFEAEHAVVAAMQQRLLAPPAPVPGLQIAAFYEPAASTLEMGGDWYETTVLPDGTLLAVIGDVVGHGVDAVAAMAQIQHLLTGLIQAGTPLEQLLSVVDSMTSGAERIYASALLLHLDPAAGRIRYLSAGHPFALLTTPDGAVTPLDGNQQPMLGLGVPGAALASIDAPAGSMLLAYTDGLIERRGESIDAGMARLVPHAAAALHRVDLDEALGELVAGVRASAPEQRATSDDTAAVLFRFSGRPGEP